MDRFILVIALMLVLAVPPAVAHVAQAQEKPKLAVFKCELFDTSGGQLPDILHAQTKRLDLITDIIIEDIKRRHVYDLVDTSRANELDSPHARFAAEGLFRECPGCEAEVALQLGADVSMGCLIQKVSNLILNINFYLRDTHSGQLTGQYSAAIRGNTDQTWTRSALWLLKNRVFEDPKLKEEREKRIRGEMP
ncbi:MAG: DUF3280 domain-containing protein [Alphaproteobacteria bacterium GM7ARS4]|nr:DUF3280 domain-containing protein [Alphaproteobacteria bacterium GM7ARS4]